MINNKQIVVDSPIGKQEVDSIGSPVGICRMDGERSYTNLGNLLRKYIDEGDQAAWDTIKSKIDYTYSGLDCALQALEKESGFSDEIRAGLDKGKKLLFKPNTVVVQNIDPQTHGPAPVSSANTEWAFVAALMRWFHDRLNISYHQMAVGEAATVLPAIAANYSMINPEGTRITTEAALEGRSGDFYGGWGFYFARQYLSENLPADADDDPMNGYQESVSGIYIPPGRAPDKLMVYDLNRLADDPSKGREVDVPDGVNYQKITLHKAIIGGDPENPEDTAAYPGCILINVPKLKVHAITLFTNIIKNLGIGLYPMQHAEKGGQQWDYSVPHHPVPGMKGGIPHEVWHPEFDHTTGLPKRDARGHYIVNKTGGITATMIDIIQAVKNQNIFMLHVVDGIETINCDHMGSPVAERRPEGIVFTSIDPVAADLLCARYMFSNVGIKEALEAGIEDGNGGLFPQKVPVAKFDGVNIVTEKGYDCPLARDICFQNAEKRGLGKRQYYVVGKDHVTDSPLVSIKGHLGTVKDHIFSDLFTQTLFFDVYKLPWDLQKTAFSYLEAVDQVEGSTFKRQFLEAFDETGSGEVTYEEYGKKGAMGAFVFWAGQGVTTMASEPLGYLKSAFRRATMMKNSDPSTNAEGHHIFQDIFIGNTLVTAFSLSRLAVEFADNFVPGLTVGKGNWPSHGTAKYFQLGSSLYGAGFPDNIVFPSLYSTAFRYADHTQNEGLYTGQVRTEPAPDALARYLSEVQKDQNNKMDFTFFVPAGFDTLGRVPVPNVTVTGDPAKILTVSFAGGKEIWT